MKPAAIIRAPIDNREPTMKRNSHVAGRGKTLTRDSSEPAANPAAGPRRRLLRALGGSGGVVLGTILASKWHKPVVEAVVLPAHAQTSEAASTVNCPITLTLSQFNASGSGGYTVSLFVGGTVLAEDEVIGGTSSSLSGASTFPPGTYSVGLSVEQNDAPLYYGIFQADCCDAQYVDSGYANSNIASNVLNPQTVFLISDDGECSLAAAAGP